MFRRIQEALWFLLENVPSLLTVAFAAYVLIQSQRSTLQLMEVLLWLLGIVGLLATSELVERHRTLRKIERVSRETLEVVKDIEISPSAESFFEREASSPLAGFPNFSEICISGMNLRRTATSHLGLFERRLKEGATLRFLLVDPDSNAVSIIAERNYVYRDPEKLKSVIESSLESLRQIGAGQNVKGSAEIRVLRYVPSYGLTMIDPNQTGGRIHVDSYPYRVPPEDYPCFWLEREKDAKWYEFFRAQFSAMWESAKPIGMISPNTL